MEETKHMTLFETLYIRLRDTTMDAEVFMNLHTKVLLSIVIECYDIVYDVEVYLPINQSLNTSFGLFITS